MALRTWEITKVRYCPQVSKEVGLEAHLVYPAEWLPDQPPRVLAHRCSEALICNLNDRATCVWAGTNPNYDPFAEA